MTVRAAKKAPSKKSPRKAARKRTAAKRNLSAVGLGGNQEANTAEQGMPDFKLDAWVALFAPAGTPDDVVAKLSDALARSLDSPDVRSRAAQGGVTARPMPSAELGQTVAADTEYWSKVIKAANIRAD